MDHPYVSKPELDVHNKEDARSQDLFPSDDDFDEDSQPRHDSDPDYNVSSSEPSQTLL